MRCGWHSWSGLSKDSSRVVDGPSVRGGCHWVRRSPHRLRPPSTPSGSDAKWPAYRRRVRLQEGHLTTRAHSAAVTAADAVGRTPSCDAASSAKTNNFCDFDTDYPHRYPTDRDNRRTPTAPFLLSEWPPLCLTRFMVSPFRCGVPPVRKKRECRSRHWRIATAAELKSPCGVASASGNGALTYRRRPHGGTTHLSLGRHNKINDPPQCPDLQEQHTTDWCRRCSCSFLPLMRFAVDGFNYSGNLSQRMQAQVHKRDRRAVWLV